MEKAVGLVLFASLMKEVKMRTKLSRSLPRETMGLVPQREVISLLERRVTDVQYWRMV